MLCLCICLTHDIYCVYCVEEKLKPIKDAVKRLKSHVAPYLTQNNVRGQHARTLYWKAIQWELMAMVTGYKAMKQSMDIVGTVSGVDLTRRIVLLT
jgi:hypothetical protein